jgi:hypothetical protein
MVDEMVHVVIDTYYEKKINIILPYYYTLALDIPMFFNYRDVQNYKILIII